jgi:hypothetical protein
MEYNELTKKLDAFEAALAAYGVTKYTAKEIWDLRAELLEDFRSVEFADPGQRREAWDRLQNGTDMVKQKGALLQVENEAFAMESEGLIEALQQKLDEIPAGEEWDKENLAALKQQAQDIFDFMRQNRWPSRERRVAVWDRYTAARTRIKEAEDAHFLKMREEQRRKKTEWKTKQEDFLRMLREKLQRRRTDGTNLERINEAKKAFQPKLEQRHLQQQNYLNKLYEDVESLQAQANEARNEDFRQKVLGWIDGRKQRIAEVDKDRIEVEARIAANAQDITDIEGKIAKINEAATELEAKIREVSGKLGAEEQPAES